MNRLLPFALLALLLAPAASAAPPVLSVSATKTSGVASLTVTFTSSGDAVSYHWQFGDGAVADGPLVSHRYGVGTWTTVVTGTSAAGETAQASVVVTVAPQTVSLAGPRWARYAARVVLRGRLGSGAGHVPVQIYRGRQYVTSAATKAGGGFAAPILLRKPGPYEARYGRTRSAPLAVRVMPRLTIALPRSAAVGGRLPLHIRLEPAAAGRLVLRVTRNGRALLTPRRTKPRDTVSVGAGAPGAVRVRVRLVPNAGYAAVARSATSVVVLPSLALGSRGQSVRELELRLADQRYALRGVDGAYELDTVEAVYAFQRLHGLVATGRVDRGVWRLLERSTTPRARFGGPDHVEVDKSRQVLLDVRGGLVVSVVHISTGATGNTPLGTWHVYRKVAGFDWVLYYPMYFFRGFAIHGYPSVPSYPASHGCVRVPMWIAQRLYESHQYGTTVMVYA